MERKFIRSTEHLLDFIEKSPSPYHVVENLRRELTEKGYAELAEGEAWQLAPGGHYFVTRNGSSLLAFRLPAGAPQGLLIAASHSDSPTFKLKPSPETDAEGLTRLNTEIYGGMIRASFLDRPLSVAGRVLLADKGGVRSVLFDAGRDLCLIPSLAIHMDRSVNEGHCYDAQTELLPLFRAADGEATVAGLVAEALGCEEEDILGSDLFLYVREKGRVWGAEGEFFSAPKIDDLQCVFASKEAFLSTENDTMIPLLAVFDNEEVGSLTRQGACSTFLPDTLTRIAEALGLSAGEMSRLTANSMMLSCDNGHAVHPAHPELADPTNRPRLNGGVVIKYNAAQKYTTDGLSEALLKRMLKKARLPYQTYANRSTVPGGSTLGNLLNGAFSLITADIGAPQLAMHSAVETGGTADTYYLTRTLAAFYRSVLKERGSGQYSLD